MSNPNQLRQQLPNPDLYDNAHENGNQSAGGAYGRKVIEDARPLTATQDHEAIAYDVAHAIKPEIDQAASLEKQKKAHDPLESAAYREVDGQRQLIGVKPFEGEPKLVATKADLERNARNATEIATREHLGGSALKMAESRQKVADMRLG